MNAYNASLISILLVEDDDIDAMGVLRAFKKSQISNEVIRARDTFQATEILKNGDVSKPYIILLDINLPGKSGLEWLCEIRADCQLRTSPVFILSTSSNDADIDKAYENQVAGYIIKNTLDSGSKALVELLKNYFSTVRLPV